MFCTKCGKQFSNAALFCSNCGAKRSHESTQNHTGGHQVGHDGSGVPEYGTGAKIWLYLCAISNGFFAFLYITFLADTSIGSTGWILTNMLGRGYLMFSVLFGVVGCICFAQIIKKNIRVPFYVIVIINIIAVVYGLVNIGIFAIFGLSNSIITYLVLRKYWPHNGEQRVVHDGNKVVFGTGAKVWLYFCAICSGINAFLRIVLIGNFPSSELSIINAFNIIGSIIVCVCFALIIKNKKRNPFYAIAVAGVISFLINIGVLFIGGVSGFIWAFIFAFSDVIITYFVLRKYWPYMDEHSDYWVVNPSTPPPTSTPPVKPSTETKRPDETTNPRIRSEFMPTEKAALFQKILDRICEIRMHSINELYGYAEMQRDVRNLKAYFSQLQRLGYCHKESVQIQRELASPVIHNGKSFCLLCGFEQALGRSSCWRCATQFAGESDCAFDAVDNGALYQV